MEDKVLYEKEGDIGIITLNNPEHGNPISIFTMRELITAYRKSAANGDRVILYMAKGKQFTVGADLKSGYEILSNPDRKAERMETLLNWQELTSVMLEHPGIIIVGYHGWVIGGGYEHTLWCDFKIAAQKTRFMLPEIELGLFFSNASTKLLPQLVGLNKAKEIMMLGDIFGADQAKEWGLVHQVCSEDNLEIEMRKLASKLLKKDPLALKKAKHIINGAYDLPVDQVLYAEGRAMMETSRSEGCQQRIEAFVKKSGEH